MSNDTIRNLMEQFFKENKGPVLKVRNYPNHIQLTNQKILMSTERGKIKSQTGYETIILQQKIGSNSYKTIALLLESENGLQFVDVCLKDYANLLPDT